jgi:hypothetical protein
MESMRRCLLALSFLLLAAPASAQSGDDVAHARQLFQTGLEAARGQHWVEAREAFAQSLALAERPSTLLNLAGAQVQTGQLVEGAASYHRFLEIATEARDRAHRSEVEAALHSVEPRIPHVTFAIDGLAPGDEVRLDGNIVLPAALASSTALDPGAHDVLVTRAGRTIESQQFQLAESLNIEIELALTPRVASATEAAQGEMDQAIAVPVEEQHGDDTGIWIAVGISVGVAVVIGVVVGVLVATQDQGAAAPYQGNFGDGIVHF